MRQEKTHTEIHDGYYDKLSGSEGGDLEITRRWWESREEERSDYWGCMRRSDGGCKVKYKNATRRSPSQAKQKRRLLRRSDRFVRQRPPIMMAAFILHTWPTDETRNEN